MISAKSVKELRDMTGAGMMDCKKALTEADGDIEKAVEVLREKGLAAAAKKAGRIASEGVVETFISEDKKQAGMVELNCETDFVSLNEEFIKLAKSLARMASVSNAKDIDEFIEEKHIDNPDKSAKEVLTDLIAKLGENMNIRRFVKLNVQNGVISSYVHGGGRIGVLVELGCENSNEILETVAKDVAMQIAATNPLFLDKTSVDQVSIEKEREI